jgi:hypothetical protein
MAKYISIGVVVVVIGISGVLVAQSSQRAADLQTQVDRLERERADAQTKAADAQAKVTALEQERATLTARLHPLEDRQRATIRLNEELVVSPGGTEGHTFSPKVPGTLTGTWRASGRGAGGFDDNITAVRLVDQNDVLLYSAGLGASGQFLVKIPQPGNYTFYFDNKGLLKSTARRVFLDGEFRPE